METLLKYAPPVVLTLGPMAWAFLLLPALGALFGAFLCRGSYKRIVGASLGAAGRDLGVVAAVNLGLLVPNNPHWDPSISMILAFFCASGAALLSCLSPYRGKRLLVSSALGGFAGQFLLPYVLAMGWLLSKAHSRFEATRSTRQHPLSSLEHP